MSFGPLISAAQVAGRLGEVRVVDTRWYLGRPGAGAAGYAAGHLPGAIHLDVDTDLSAPASPQAGRHPLPTPEAFAATLARAGIAAGTPVVAYDDAGGSIAARLWWMLHVLDEPVAVLDGGLSAWTGPLDTGVATPAAAQRAPAPWPADRFLDADALAAGLRDGRVIAYDARAAERYLGAMPGVDPRPGHIPGAVNRPWADNLDAPGRFADPAELRAGFPAAFAGSDGGARFADRTVVAYCGSGVTACHDLLALTLAGATRLALYPGSWSQWGADDTRPASTTPHGAPS